jgi:hypothetical protein
MPVLYKLFLYLNKEPTYQSNYAYLEIKVSGKGDEDANDGDHEGGGDPRHCVRLERVEFHPAEYANFN